jgi:hypothetical protein
MLEADPLAVVDNRETHPVIYLRRPHQNLIAGFGMLGCVGNEVEKDVMNVTRFYLDSG